jgi:hypothetical protein
MYKCVCGSYEDESENYLHQHQVACFWHIRDERDRFKQALREIAKSTDGPGSELARKIATETLATSCGCCWG